MRGPDSDTFIAEASKEKIGDGFLCALRTRTTSCPGYRNKKTSAATAEALA